MREPISIDEHAKAQEAKAQGKEWKPDPEPPAHKAPEPKAHEGKGFKTPEEQPDKAAPGNMPWNRRS